MSPPRMRLWSVVLDAPDAQQLASFYERLLGWAREQDEPGWVKLRSPDGGTDLSFAHEPAYQRPRWPTRPPDQQMMLHLDIRVEDLAPAGEPSAAVGAVLADFLPRPDVRVYLAPAAQPCCLLWH